MSRSFSIVDRVSSWECGADRARVEPCAPIGIGEIGLPDGTGRILLRELLADGKAVAVALERAGQIVPGVEHSAEFFVADGGIALPIGIRGILFSELVGNGNAVAIALERAGKIALGLS